MAFRAQDPPAREVRARLGDRTPSQDDFVGVMLDTFNDERRGFEFFVNPLGVQMDLIQKNHRRRGLVVGHDLGVGRPDHRRRLRDRDGGPVLLVALPGTAADSDLGIDACASTRASSAHRVGLNPLPRGSNCYLCQVVEARRVSRHHAGPQHGAGPRPSPPTDNRVGATTPAALPSTRRPGGRPRPHRPLGHDAQHHPQRGGQPRLLAGRGRRRRSSTSTSASPSSSPRSGPSSSRGRALRHPLQAIFTRTIADPCGASSSPASRVGTPSAASRRETRNNLLIPASQGSDLRFRGDVTASTSCATAATSPAPARPWAAYSPAARATRLPQPRRRPRHASTAGARARRCASRSSAPTRSTRCRWRRASASAAAHGAATPRASSTSTVARQHALHLQYQEVSDGFRADLGFIPQVGYRKGYFVVAKYLYADHGEHWWTRLTLAAESTWTYDPDGNPLQRQVSPYFWFNGPEAVVRHGLPGARRLCVCRRPGPPRRDPDRRAGRRLLLGQHAIRREISRRCADPWIGPVPCGGWLAFTLLVSLIAADNLLWRVAGWIASSPFRA